MFKDAFIKRSDARFNKTTNSNNNLSKYATYASMGILVSTVMPEVFAQNADAATQLSPMLDKILGSLGGTLGKVIMAIGLLLSAIAALAGMNKAVILTPVGIGFLLGNAKTIIDWMFV